jgi:hypothetical protein
MKVETDHNIDSLCLGENQVFKPQRDLEAAWLGPESKAFLVELREPGRQTSIYFLNSLYGLVMKNRESGAKTGQRE